MPTLRRCSTYQKRAAEQCEALLRDALKLAKIADSPRTIQRIRLAIKSAGGAVRHAHRRFNARPTLGVLHVTNSDRRAFDHVEQPVEPLPRSKRELWYRVGQYA